MHSVKSTDPFVNFTQIYKYILLRAQIYLKNCLRCTHEIQFHKNYTTI